MTLDEEGTWISYNLPVDPATFATDGTAGAAAENCAHVSATSDGVYQLTDADCAGTVSK